MQKAGDRNEFSVSENRVEDLELLVLGLSLA